MPSKTETRESETSKSEQISKTKANNAAIAARTAALPKIPQELLDQVVADGPPMNAQQINATTMALKKALIERALGAELSHHLGYRPGAQRPEGAVNHRNGASAKTVHTDDGPLRIEVPRDRQGSFEPLLVPTHERRFTGFDDKIIALYARGMTVREIQGFLAEQYGTQVSPEFISAIADAVMAEVTAWQSRPLEPMYPVVFFDALRVKIREDAVVRNKAIYLALGVRPDGTREILGLWIEGTEGAKFWMKVFNDLKTRGLADIPEAHKAALANPVLKAVIRSAITQRIGVVTGLQKEFSWEAMAAAGVGTGLGTGLGPAAGEVIGRVLGDVGDAISEGAKAFIQRDAAGLANGAAVMAMRGGRSSGSVGAYLKLDPASRSLDQMSNEELEALAAKALRDEALRRQCAQRAGVPRLQRQLHLVQHDAPDGRGLPCGLAGGTTGQQACQLPHAQPMLGPLGVRHVVVLLGGHLKSRLSLQGGWPPAHRRMRCSRRRRSPPETLDTWSSVLELGARKPAR
jgi:hypothetical protein